MSKCAARWSKSSRIALHLKPVKIRKVDLLTISMRTPRAICLLCFLALFFPARAAVQFDVLPGYESAIHEAAWFPITNDLPQYAERPS